MSDELTFVDTNILVYAYDIDAGAKHQIANDYLKKIWQDRIGTLSTQVLQEFYVTVTRKIPHTLSKPDTGKIIEVYLAWNVYRPTPRDMLVASELEQRYKLSFWDALIVTAAEKTGATRLLSEDMQNEQQIGKVTIINPFMVKG